MRKVTRAIFFAAILFAASVAFFASRSLPALAQQSPDQQRAVRAPAGATIDETTAAAIAVEGELKATVRTFQGDNPSAVLYRYYWWHDNCYARYQPGSYQLVTADYCQH